MESKKIKFSGGRCNGKVFDWESSHEAESKTEYEFQLNVDYTKGELGLNISCHDGLHIMVWDENHKLIKDELIPWDEIGHY